MIKMDYFLLGVFWFTLGHIAVFFQLNGQFKWERSEERRVGKECRSGGWRYH